MDARQRVVIVCSVLCFPLRCPESILDDVIDMCAIDFPRRRDGKADLKLALRAFLFCDVFGKLQNAITGRELAAARKIGRRSKSPDGTGQTKCADQKH